jgi:hypothetical protein
VKYSTNYVIDKFYPDNQQTCNKYILYVKKIGHLNNFVVPIKPWEKIVISLVSMVKNFNAKTRAEITKKKKIHVY